MKTGRSPEFQNLQITGTNGGKSIAVKKGQMKRMINCQCDGN